MRHPAYSRIQVVIVHYIFKGEAVHRERGKKCIRDLGGSKGRGKCNKGCILIIRSCKPMRIDLRREGFCLYLAVTYQEISGTGFIVNNKC